MALPLGLLLTMVTVWAYPARAATSAPTLFADDAPLIRATTVRLGFLYAPGTNGSIVGFRLSNDPAVDANGRLTNGVDVPEVTSWTVAVGADGPRTVYGQGLDVAGEWTSVNSISMVLDRGGTTALAIDSDRLYGFTPDGAHVVAAAPGFDVSADLVRGFGGAIIGFTVGAAGWSVSVGSTDGPLPIGSPQTIDGSETGPFVAVDQAHGSGCRGASGTFTVHELSYYGTTDLMTAAVDFRITCPALSGLVAGSIRYGATADFRALDQSSTALFFGTGLSALGTTTAPESITFSNMGTAAMTLGAVTIDGDSPGDFAVSSDSCSGAELLVGGSCSVSVTSTPSTRGHRFAKLEVPDETPRGSRSVLLGITGFQPTTTTLAVTTPSTTGAQLATVIVTISPAPDGGYAYAAVDGLQLFGPSETTLEGPSRREYRFTKSIAPGTHLFEASFKDGPSAYYLNSEAQPVTLTLDPEPDPADTTAPTTTSPVTTFVTGPSIAPMRLTWSGSDAGSGIARYEISRSQDGLPYETPVTSLSAAASITLSPGHSYRFRVRAVDKAGNVGAWSNGRATSVGGISETSAPIRYARSWLTGVGSTYWGGRTRYSRTAGASVSLRFTGRSIGWVSALGPTRGQALIYVNGSFAGKVNLFASASRARDVVFSRTWSTTATRTITIRVVGTIGHSRVDIDGFVVGS